MPKWMELGSGYRPWPEPGWEHTDLYPSPGQTKVDAEELLEWVNEEEWEKIRATHILEHFPFDETRRILEEWHQALIPGGELYIEVPHIVGHIRAWQGAEIPDKQLVTYIFGEQDAPGNFHKAAFTEPILRGELEGAGFKDVRVQDIGMVLNAWAFRPQ